MDDLKEVMDRYFKHIKIDRNLAKQLKKFKINWANKSPEYAEFLGGTYIGVNPIRFSSRDDDELMARLLRVDAKSLKEELLEVPEINKIAKGANGKLNKNVVVANVIYNTVIYLMYRFNKEFKNKRQLEDVINDLFSIMSYKILGSIVYAYFSYSLDKNTATVVYDRLSKKYLIKQLESWQGVIDFKTKDVLEKGIHYKRITNYNTDEVLLSIADIQGKYRSMVQHIYGIIEAVEKEGMRLKVSSTVTTDEEGNPTTADITDTPARYNSYLLSIIYSENDFIKDEIITLVTDVMNNVSFNDLKETLQHISRTSLIDAKISKELIPSIIETSISYINEKEINSYSNSIEEIIDVLKRYWSSSRTKSKNVSLVKNKLFDISKDATGKKTDWVLAAINISVILYIFIRSISIKTYQ